MAGSSSAPEKCHAWQSWDWAVPELAIEGIKSLIKAVPDFPKPGILFRDIMPIFQVPSAVNAVVDLIVAYIDIHYAEVDVIVGLEARGFLIAPMVAVQLGKAFVPIRKMGKLPGQCVRVESTKEYGQDILEVQVDAVKAGQKVVIIDDLLATGGTMASTCRLIEAVKGEILGCLCLIELCDLKGREKVRAPFHAFIEY